MSDPVEGCAFVQKQDTFHWSCTLKGPKGSDYENQQFLVDIEFPQEFPYKPPLIRLLTRINHINIDRNGKIDMYILFNMSLFWF